MFIIARFQFPFLNIRKIFFDNVINLHSAGDILRYYFCRRRLDALHTVAKVILVALSTQNHRYLVIHHHHYCLNTQFSQPRPAVVKRAGMTRLKQTLLLAPSVIAWLPSCLPATCRRNSKLRLGVPKGYRQTKDKGKAHLITGHEGPEE